MSRFLQIEGTLFKDEHNRQVTLRGVNLAADAKFPARPNQPSHIAGDFFDGDNVSFVGRPFPYEEADVHLRRIRGWGFNTVRYLFTWEAIEGKGPGIYDEEWIKSTIALLRKCKEYDLFVFMDPHQDVWSRFSGGSGAPMWTVYAMGLNPQAFAATEAALIHNTYPNSQEFPKMIWSTNYTRLACMTMFTMFFAGRDFTPKCIINGKNIQDYLHEHYLNALKHLALRIGEAGDLEDSTVIGWESLNEPNRGLIGYQKLDAYPKEQKNHKGTSPTAWQAILTGSGRACDIDTYEMGGTGPYKTGTALIDPKGVQAWLPADYDDSRYGWERDPGWKLGECIWAQHGVWDPETDTLLRNDYFSKAPDGTPLATHEWCNIYFMNHYRQYSRAIRSVHKKAVLFCQPPVFEIPPVIKGTADEDDRLVYAPHFYDGITLMTKSWNRYWNIDVLGFLRGRYWSPVFAIKIGETAIRKCFKDQLIAIREEGIQNIGQTPCLFSEIGIPYDMDKKAAYSSGDYSSQIHAMDANQFALEGAKVGFTLWTYCTTNDHTWGDQWNGEDLSIFSVDDNAVSAAEFNPDGKTQAMIETSSIAPSSASSEMTADPARQPSITVAGNRAAEAFIRPAPIYTAGTLVKYGFDLARVTFELKLEAGQSTQESSPTEIFVPPLHFPKDQMSVTTSGGKWEYNEQTRILKWWHNEAEQSIKIVGVKPLSVEVENDNLALQLCGNGCSVV
ncbi:glycoside hydrolase [Terfezia boudieri ATCC MYA-4762]|uniref:Glycoside hydrolase n=1 Tax=Terfezia boudieri ATCC MYA-4762 TaxID=1051890 RepID=A0A3N4LN05_9PEZI|nr:glycoside hydrolase [Terfezia boudieri ATCC MYA-4762]